jgi:hypothetical protein
MVWWKVGECLLDCGRVSCERGGGGGWGSVSFMGMGEYLVKGGGRWGECLLDGGGRVDSLPP